MNVSLSQPPTYWDGLILASLLVISRFGLLLKTHADVPTRQWLCSILGFVLASLVLDNDVGYFVLVTFTAITLICLLGPRYGHYGAFVTMFGYLSLYRINHGSKIDLFANYLIASTTLNVTGIAFEIHNTYNMMLKGNTPPPRPKFKKIIDDDILKIRFIDILHYTFNYTTILTGPYLRYQTYIDFIQMPYSVIYKRPTYSEDKIFQLIPFLVITFWSFQGIWPTDYLLSAEFSMRSPLYKVLTCGIIFLKYRLLCYLCYCVMIQINMYAGLGVYEKQCNNVCVHGPTKYVDNLPNLIKRRLNNVPTDLVFDIRCIEVTKPVKCEFSSSVTEGLKHWNRGLSYWLDEYINKGLFLHVANTNVRHALTGLVCLLWFGVHPSMWISGVLVLYYLYLESIFIDFLKNKSVLLIYKSPSKVNGAHRINLRTNRDKNKTVGRIDIGLWFSKQIVFAWCLMPYFLPNISDVMTLYTGTMLVPLVFLVFVHFMTFTLADSKSKAKDGGLSESEMFIEYKF